ncbi:two-component system response regulator YcbB [Clostridium saccharoperbutylacetonicum]|uniref:Stage 0 sporulation protein A homolog n=1 Tax=Clostridium saccharoperbutylacetonicum N1-4(HMT) TaxID=931276 RepID=M1MKP1_9CLOT|nr:response regulator [Clostridium saccharoperbutylacetonicum]AGF55386.1 transcriptional regulatory protein GlnL [Clostridium saccharoperbutylacetonicum N1-4(HMT)]NRT63901.1 two-component system response regulator YcbB [Clostridium saccharoperbutylacetonicum]NSB27266.1 two-component system response regulator YcbB [Clostridium saccharoperbutylacetonicum]NSB40753.1 two-component system response regulator YcbB [Clostridium saccharoperbutylacetonicum]
METTFIVIDDDIAICKILEQTIKKNQLGRVLSILTTGKNAKDVILKINPDIVLIDLLLPEVDGIEIVKNIIWSGYKGKVIMISQVEEGEMISNAYKSGILFYINKPINMIETISVITNVKKQVELEKSISMIKSVVFQENIEKNQSAKKESEDSLEDKLMSIFSDINIVGTAGVDELKLVILNIVSKKQVSPSKPYQLKGVYMDVARELYGDMLASINCKSMEQRIRRTITKAMTSLASFGIENEENSLYKEYAYSLFDIKQVKQEIKHLKHPSFIQGKINTKKFIEGILIKILN